MPTLRTAAIICLAFLAALTASSPRAAIAADAKTKLHELPDRSFSIELPESWAASKYDNPRVALQFKPDVERKEGQITDVFNITTTLDTEKLKETVDEFANAVREAAKEGGGTLSPEVTDTKLGGEPAKAFSYTKTLQGRPITHFRIVTVRNGRGYILVYLCDSENAESAKKLLDQAAAGFKWIEPKKK